MTAEDYRREILDSLFDNGLYHFGVPEGTWPEDGSSSDEEDED